MNEVSKSRKIAGEIFAIITILLLIAIFAVSIFIGGQKKAIEKICTSIAADDYKAFSNLYISPDEEAFAGMVKKYCDGLMEDSTDIIGSDVMIDYHKYSSSDNIWSCSADIDFYCSGKNYDFDDVIFELRYNNGKWYIVSIK